MAPPLGVRSRFGDGLGVLVFDLGVHVVHIVCRLVEHELRAFWQALVEPACPALLGELAAVEIPVVAELLLARARLDLGDDSAVAS